MPATTQKVYIVIEDEAMEDGSHYQSIIGAWFDKTRAQKYAAAQTGGRYMRWDVKEVEVQDSEAETGS